MVVLQLVALAFLVVFGVSDEQRCYYDAGKLAHDYIVPCYTGFEGAFSCCKRGNVCLQQNACYDGETGTTYQYGCTDGTYKDAKCPQKCGLDREKSSWTGLVYCDGTGKTPNNTWLCHHPENCGDRKHCPKSSPWKPEIEKLLPAVTCSDLNYGPQYKAFSAPARLSNLMNIPEDGPGLTSYYSAHPTSRSTPVSTSAFTSTSTSTSGSTTSSSSESSASPAIQTTTSSETASSTPESPPSQSKKEKVGMAVGIGVGIPIGIALIGTMIFMIRRGRYKLHPEEPPIEHNQPEKYGYVGRPGSPSTPGPDSGFKAELPGESRPVFEMNASSPRSELFGLEVDHNSLKSPFVSPLESEFSGIRRSAVSDMPADRIYELPA